MSENGKNKSLRATNIELQSRDISISADDRKIYLRDTDNLYPLRMEKVINNSPTGRRSSNMMAKFIVGNGVDGNVIVNKKGETINDIADLAAGEIATNYGVFFHLDWAFETEGTEIVFKKSNIRVLDSVNMAKSKEDDDGFPGKFYKLQLQEKKNLFGKSDSKSAKWFYPYNEDKNVILAQMKNDCKLKGITDPTTEQLFSNYRGQVFYLNLTPKYHYSLPPWDSVYDDMDTEYRISRYNNKQARTGWLGKTVVKKFADDEDDEEFNKVLKENLGAENSADVMVISVPVASGDDIDKLFKIDQVKAQFDDKLFDSTKKTLRENITGAFNNIPEALVFAGSGALFGTSADTYTEMKKFYWEQNEYERFKLEQALGKLLDTPVNFLPIIEEMVIDEDVEIRRKAQAELRGSVGGVTALIALQQSVAAQTTDISSAVEIIKEIYGISEETARKMLGTPAEIKTDTTDGVQ